MDIQERLFLPLPSHIYVACHWAPGGWACSFLAQTPTRGGAESVRRVYDLLGAGELVDVIGSELGKALNL